MGLVIYMLAAIAIAHGTCLGAFVLHVSVYSVADDSPISNETGLAADGGV